MSLLIGPSAYASGGGTGGGGGGGGGGGAVVAPVLLQADWPVAVPLPVGRIVGTTGVKPSETVAILVNGSAPAVNTALIALYRSNGFAQAPNGQLVFSAPGYLVVVVTRNHDHSNTKTDVIVWLRSL